MGQGPQKAKVMLVGEAPGQREDDIRVPFSGLAGRKLTKALAERGIDRDDLYITNVVKCRPPDNRTPTAEEVKACLPYLWQEIDAVQPDLIVSLGSVALQALLKLKGVMKYRGQTLIRESTLTAGTPVLVCLHPAAAQHQPALEELFQQDMDALAAAIRGEHKVHREPEVIVLTEVSDLYALARWIAKEGQVMAYDLETEGLESWVEGRRIWCVSMAFEPDVAYVLPLEHPDFNWGDDVDEVNKFLTFIFEKAKLRRVAHNGEFDNRWLRTRGFAVRHDFDTMVAHHLLDENFSHSLKELARRYCGAGLYEDKVDVTARPPEYTPLMHYAGLDAAYTLQLYYRFREELKKDERLVRFFKFISMPTTEVLSHIEATGIYVDREKLLQRIDEAQENRKKVLKELNRMAVEAGDPIAQELRMARRAAKKLKEQVESGDTTDKTRKAYTSALRRFRKAKKACNWNSNTKYVPHVLFDLLELDVLGYTTKGKPSTAEAYMKQLKGAHPIADKLLEFRLWDKRLSTFLLPWVDYSQYDSRLHAGYNQTGTVTGRLSSSDPNLQQTERGPFIRGVLGARPGWKLVSADLSQAEMRIATMYSYDDALMAVYLADGDVHVETAKEVTGKSEVTAAERKKAKAVNFGFIFGMGWKKFKEYAKEKYDVEFTDEEAQEAREAFFAKYPKLLLWHDRQRKLVHKFKYVRSPLGRIRHLPDIDSEKRSAVSEAERQAINSPVQSFASDICLFAACLLMPQVKANPGIEIVGLVHDCILFEVREDLAESWGQKVKKTMEHLPLAECFGYEPPVPIKADIKISQYWAGEA